KIEGGTYSHSKFIASFIGFAPYDNPLLAIAVSVDEPHPVYYGGDVAAPVFKGVVEETLKYLNIKGLQVN
ncbi:MAG: penicillin-binding protein 2, partial [Candidatus Omnitrophica bacterium]|nr:penicillin-binding protein 2 [Candidatus Omnitrophota bacterium]